MKPVEEHAEAEHDYEEIELPATTSWCCFHSSCFPWRKRNEFSLLQEKQGAESVSADNWVIVKAKKLKELSELVAGPKWKTFIRKFKFNVGNNNRRRRNGDFQYDAQSYALNFDQDEDDDDDDARLAFRSRFAAPVSGQLNRS